MNIERITQLRDHLAQLPDSRFNINIWVKDKASDNSDLLTAAQVRHNCGTCACIGGWADALFQPDDYRPMESLLDDTALLLGLTVEQVFRLTHPQVDWNEVTREVAVEALTILLETGEINYEKAIANVQA